MYDAERRSRFLSTISNNTTRGMYASLFERIGQTESELGMYLEDMSDEDAKLALSSKKPTRVSTVKNTIYLIQKYADWCVENGIEFKPKITYATFGAFTAITDWMVQSPQALQERLDRAFLKENAKTSDNLCRVYLWLLYMGIEPERAADVNTKDVDLSVPCVFQDGVPYQIPPEAFTSFFTAVALDAFYVPHPIHADAFMPRVSSEKLLRSVKSVPSRKVIENKIKQKANEAGERLSTNDIFYSGVFYRAYLGEQETGKADLSQYVMYVLSKSNVYNDLSHLQKQRRYHSVLSRVRRDYNNWKEAFAF